MLALGKSGYVDQSKRKVAYMSLAGEDVKRS